MAREVICAYAEPAAGPGWGNSPIWVIERDENGKLHQRCIQPEEQTAEMATLYSVSAAAHSAMTKAVAKASMPKKQRA